MSCFFKSAYIRKHRKKTQEEHVSESKLRPKSGKLSMREIHQNID